MQSTTPNMQATNRSTAPAVGTTMRRSWEFGIGVATAVVTVSSPLLVSSSSSPVCRVGIHNWAEAVGVGVVVVGVVGVVAVVVVAVVVVVLAVVVVVGVVMAAVVPSGEVATSVVGTVGQVNGFVGSCCTGGASTASLIPNKRALTSVNTFMQGLTWLHELLAASSLSRRVGRDFWKWVLPCIHTCGQLNA